MRVAVDAMGGDHAPGEIVAGAELAARDLGIEIVLTGEPQSVSRELAARGARGIEIVDAPELIGMSEAAGMAVRRKRRASVVAAMELVRDGRADAMVTAGHTGAAMAAALFTLGRIAGAERPAIAVVIPTLAGQAVLLDVGANVDSKPQHLLQFALMGSVYARSVLGIAHPRVALLSIGEEASKGNDVTLRAAELLRGSGASFIGNVEGRGLFHGETDVAVCDGFVGNILLKSGEGIATMILSLLKDELVRSPHLVPILWLLSPRLHRFSKRLDYAEHGGAPLLGVNGVCVIAHGRSKAKAIRSAIGAAAVAARSHIVDQISAEIAGIAPAHAGGR